MSKRGFFRPTCTASTLGAMASTSPQGELGQSAIPNPGVAPDVEFYASELLDYLRATDRWPAIATATGRWPWQLTLDPNEYHAFTAWRKAGADPANAAHYRALQ